MIQLIKDLLRKFRVPPVVLWSTMIWSILLVAAILVWFCELKFSKDTTSGPRLYEVMVDGLKVGLGALIGVMSQWAGKSFAPKQGRGSGSPAGQGKPASSD